ncbi:type II toxin-antitoxin system YhaV family toxin [Desulfonatronovibrio magnus]|uniref:type II toxin-antitoxin system YhaV family toxin n=1 Tax=Desulfonatronovibrio magnus TaxID=698827 RepID=UPI0005EAD7F6|nr:type II toxin-antitoxin system YhaV family toxin [Desulfonatronovibrio magnus]
MQTQGWTLLFHDCLVQQLKRLSTACHRARSSDPEDWPANANVKLFHALSRLMLRIIPVDPGHPGYRQGNTWGEDHRYWCRARIGRRFRLFFRYDSASKIIIYAWVNDQKTLRQAKGKKDPYTVFRKMLHQGNPPDDWDQLLDESDSEYKIERI